jgi:deazaflavin-dependent oxidoreductase (nitroreductase family)
MNVKDTLGKAVNVVHRTVYTATGGRIGGSGFGMPVVILTTIGRKSGQPRDTMLTAPLEDGHRVVLVASWGGDDRNPQWLLNIRANPDVEVTLRGKKQKMRAHVASAEERAELWPRITKEHANYADYQTKTEREIPVVVLDPA